MAKDRGSSPLFILVAMLSAVAALYFAKEILLPHRIRHPAQLFTQPTCRRSRTLALPTHCGGSRIVLMSVRRSGRPRLDRHQPACRLGRQLPPSQHNLIAKIKSLRPNSPASPKFRKRWTTYATNWYTAERRRIMERVRLTRNQRPTSHCRRAATARQRACGTASPIRRHCRQ